MSKTRLNISLDQDLAIFIKRYVKDNRTSVANLMTQFILSLKREKEGNNMEIILSNPDFYHALLEVKSKLHDGTTQWHSFDEVFNS